MPACPYCAEQISPSVSVCPYCKSNVNEPLPASRRDPGQDAGMRMLLPVGRSGWAIAAGYLGLLSPLMVFAPFALIFSIVAIRDIQKHPDRHGMGRAIFGLVMGALFTIGVAVVLIMIAMGK